MAPGLTFEQQMRSPRPPTDAELSAARTEAAIDATNRADDSDAEDDDPQSVTSSAGSIFCFILSGPMGWACKAVALSRDGEDDPSGT